HRPRGQDVVAPRPGAALQAREPRALERPGRAQAAGDRPWEEGVEALAEPRARRVLRRGDFDVVPAVVLDEEVAVAGLGEGDAAQPALEAVALVAELVCGVDRHAADHPHGQREPDLLD